MIRNLLLRFYNCVNFIFCKSFHKVVYQYMYTLKSQLLNDCILFKLVSTTNIRICLLRLIFKASFMTNICERSNKIMYDLFPHETCSVFFFCRKSPHLVLAWNGCFLKMAHLGDSKVKIWSFGLYADICAEAIKI